MGPGKAVDALPGQARLVLVAGATGNLGGRVVRELLSRGKRVRALVREGSDATQLEARGVEIARGDLRDRASLDRALVGAYAVVTTAQGYLPRKKGDTLAATDDQGNRNLVDAAKAAGASRFVFTSILTCDLAKEVPHFWQKKLIEDYLEGSGVPFVALRPGAFISPPAKPGDRDWWGAGLRKGKLMGFGSVKTPWTFVHIDDVARCLAAAVDEPRAAGRRIDIGADRPVSMVDLAAITSKLMGRDIKLTTGMGRVFGGMMRLWGLFRPGPRDMIAMIDYFATGKYVADTGVQKEVFGNVPTMEDSMARYLEQVGLPSKKSGTD